jgi:hypothetical protein
MPGTEARCRTGRNFAVASYRLIGLELAEEFNRNGEMRLLLLRYTQALIAQKRGCQQAAKIGSHSFSTRTNHGARSR